MNWQNLESVDQLQKIDELSGTSPVVLFKHSTRCSISAAALDRLERKWKEEDFPEVKTYFLDLIAHRDISNAIAEKYAIEHQSPQILVIKDGKCTYDVSHLGISFEMLKPNIG